MKNRLGILVVYDKDGIVDEYIIYLLNELKTVLSHIVIVCNGEMKKDAIDKLNEYTKDVFIRSNMGYDAGAFKDTLYNLLGWEQVSQYDELVLINDTFYGPFEPFRNIFDTMQSKNVDFWGLTAQPKTKCSYEAYGMEQLPYHIQSYFIVIRSNLLKNKIFRDFWDTMEETNSYMQAVINYELRMTEYFTSHGFHGTSYVDITSQMDENNNDNLFLIYDYAYQMLINKKMPVIKRRFFVISQDSGLFHSINEDSQRVLNYIDRNTNYDVGMIWENLIRNYDPTVLKQSIHMEYVLPYKVQTRHREKKREVAVIAHLYYEDLIDECFEYLMNIPDNYDIFITVQSDKTASLIKEKCLRAECINIEVRLVGKRGRDVGALLVGCQDILMKYKYLCFVHDKKTSGGVGPAKIGMSYRYMLWENMLKSEYYIENIINLLEQEKHLGVLVPPSPYHSEYINNYGNEWTCCYSGTKELAHRLKLKCIMSEENPPFTLSTAFWCKTKALKRLFEFGFSYEDFPEEPLPPDGSIGHNIERIFAYVAQHEGYATGIIMNDAYARLQLSNYNYMVNNLLAEEHHSGYFGYYYGLTHPKQYYDYMDLSDLLSFCRRQKKLYIYGAGGIAGKIVAFLTVNHIQFEGFIVSKNHKNSEAFVGKKIFEIDEIQDPDTGIILGLSEINAVQVLPILKSKGFANIYKIKNE